MLYLLLVLVLAFGSVRAEAQIAFSFTGPNVYSGPRSTASPEIPNWPIKTDRYEFNTCMYKANSGKLLLFFKDNICNDCAAGTGVIKLQSSTDGGLTWTTPTTLVSETGMDHWDCGGGVTSTGRVIIFYLRTLPGPGAAQSINYITSDDEGVSWSAAATLDVGIQTSFSSYGDMIQIGGGKLLKPWWGAEGANQTLWVTISADNGATWGDSIAVGNGAPTYAYSEGAFAYLGSDTIIGVCRDQSRGHQFVSTDNGETWEDQGLLPVDPYSAGFLSPRLEVYQDANDVQTVVAFWTARSGAHDIASMIGQNLASGPAGWDMLTRRTEYDLGWPGAATGYPSVVSSEACRTKITWNDRTPARVGFLGVASQELTAEVSQLVWFCAKR